MIGLITLPFFCSNIFTPWRLHSRKKCHDMPLFMVLAWKLFQWMNWIHCHVYMRKGSGRSMPFNSGKGVQPALLMWAPTPFHTIMGYTLLHHLRWLSDCLLHLYRMGLGSTAMGMWMVPLVPGSTTIKFWGSGSVLFAKSRHFVHSIELGDINMKGFLFFFSELFFGILTGRTVGTRGEKKKE